MVTLLRVSLSSVRRYGRILALLVLLLLNLSPAEPVAAQHQVIAEETARTQAIAEEAARTAFTERIGHEVALQRVPGSNPESPVFKASLQLEPAEVPSRLASLARLGVEEFSFRRLAEPAQASGWSCDWSQCDIWGVASNAGWYWVDRLNVCTGVVTMWGYAAPALWTVASGGAIGGVPQLVYGDLAGATFCSTTPPPPVIPGCPPGLAPGSYAFTEGAPDPFYAGADVFNPSTLAFEGRTYDPLAPLGGTGWGPSQYALPESDLVFGCSPAYSSAAPPLIAEVASAPGVWQLAWVSRANGRHFFLRPPGGRAYNYDGLAYDGYGRLWGSWKPPAGGAWTLDLVNPTTGMGTPTWGILPWMTDLASTPACGECAVDEGRDFGDAPDSTNHFVTPMTAYVGVQALFPTVYDAATGSPSGPMHRLSGDSWLGTIVTNEADADLLPDQDGLTNIDPPTDSSDRDGGDDGVVFPVSLPQCQLTQFQYRVNVSGPQMNRYVNVWFDFNRNGQWGDQIQCSYQGQPYTVAEWAVQNQITNLGPGVHTLSTPVFRALDPQDRLWMRITLSETDAPAADASGYKNGYEIGETEDFRLTPIGNSEYR